jgi:SAM-dependent methyltransferase
LANRIGLRHSPPVGDLNKSWDVLLTAQFIDGHVSKQAPVLDIGAQDSEILPILLRMGYETLTGIDLDAAVREMPGRDRIRYEVRDFTNTGFPPETFQAITAISAIEHGFRSKQLLTEVSRLLLPGGFFLASFDYWPEKIATDSVRLYGLDWRIFSEGEVRGLIAEAEQHRLVPIGPIDLTAADRTVQWLGREYTFAWLVLQKSVSDEATHDLQLDAREGR